jgi:peroxiredoxin
MATDQLPPELDSRPQARREWSGWLRSLVLPLGLVVAIVGGLLYYESTRGLVDEASGYGTVALPESRNVTGREPAAAIGRAAPDFLLETPDGSALHLSDLQGRPVVVNFWASWCTSCRLETPTLIDTYDSHGKDGLVMVGVNLREATERVQRFVSDYGISYPVAIDRSGEVARTWRIGGPNQGLPSTYFIDRQGVVQKVVYGTVSDRIFAEGLGLILEGRN